MKLEPPDPPGRSSRKARRYAQEMRELRAQGYTFEAIRKALAAVGVHVSNATVQREVARASPATPARPATEVCSPPSEVNAAPLEVPPTAASPSMTPTQPKNPVSRELDLRSGKEIAEAFARGRISNPLARARLNTKDPS